MTRLSNSQNVIVLLGGNSPERAISLESGTAVARALSEVGYQVRQLDPADQPLSDFNWGTDPLAVIMLHGTYGEDGQVQAELEDLKIPYTGSDEVASQLAFHKHSAKEVFLAHQLPTPDWKVLPSTIDQQELECLATEIGYPVILKPEAQGSSIGVSIVRTADELWQALQLAKEFDDLILIEKAICGEEWTVPVLDRQPLPAIRISSNRSFFDFAAKYEDDHTKYEVIKQSESETSQRATVLSLKACELLKTAGVCRVDLMVDDSGQPWLLEVNTIPGMTDHSLVPKAAYAHGWSMSDLCERILLPALPNRSN